MNYYVKQSVLKTIEREIKEAIIEIVGCNKHLETVKNFVENLERDIRNDNNIKNIVEKYLE